jgi:hypothetical protein
MDNKIQSIDGTKEIRKKEEKEKTNLTCTKRG